MSNSARTDISRAFGESGLAGSLIPRVQLGDPRKPASLWSADLGHDEYINALGVLAARPSEALSLYLHIPFCPGRCLYCGCNTTVTHDGDLIEGYLDLLEREIEMVAEQIGQGSQRHPVAQLHLAGGTPNYLNDAQLSRLVEMIEASFDLGADAERSIECDPRRATASQLDLLRALGFKRISFGVQDLDAQVQRAIGRVQSEELIRDVHAMARDAGFDSISLELIYGLPHQDVAVFDRTLDVITALQPDRIVCHGYSRSTLTKVHQHGIDVHHLPSEETRQAIFQHAVDRLTDAGYQWIGLDSFALPTDDWTIAQQQGRLHRNLIGYTDTPGRHLIGFGSSALGEVEDVVVQNTVDLPRWQSAIEQGRFAIAQGHHLSQRDRCRRDAITHLICNLELPVSMAAGCLQEEYERLAAYAHDGLFELQPDRLRVTRSGRFFLRDLCSELGAYFDWDRARWHVSRST